MDYCDDNSVKEHNEQRVHTTFPMDLAAMPTGSTPQIHPQGLLDTITGLTPSVSYSGGVGRARECVFLTNSQVMLTWGPHFENHWSGHNIAQR